MEGREGIELSGSPPYYFNREGISGHNPGSFLGSGTQSGLPTPHPFKNSSNPDLSIQNNARDSHLTSSYLVDIPSPNYGHGINVGAASVDPVTGKKKRGRPRKYGPGGANNMSLELSPISPNLSSGSMMPGERKNRGRPPGSGRKQRLASLGEWMNSSAGSAFTPHVIHIEAGEDVAAKIFSFAQQRPRALCVLSANGSLSAVTLHQPTSSVDAVTYEGRFEILCMSGSYLLSEEGGPRNRTGGLSISFCNPDGIMLGGAVVGRLIAASLVQAVVCSFVYGGASKIKSNTDVDADTDSQADQKSEANPAESSSAPATAASIQYHSPPSGMGIWPPSSHSIRDPKTEIDPSH